MSTAEGLRLRGSGFLLPHLRHGALPHQPQEARRVQGRMRRHHGHHRGPQLRAHDRGRLLRPLRPRPRRGRDPDHGGQGRGHRLRDQGPHQAAGSGAGPGRRSRRARDQRHRPGSGRALHGHVRPAGRRARSSPSGRPSRARRSGASWASSPAASTARWWRSCTAPPSAWTRTTRTSCCRGRRCALADGWGGSMIGTELQDIMFGTPTPLESQDQPGRAQGGRGQHRRPRPRAAAVGDDHAGRRACPRCRRRPSRWGPRASTWRASAAPPTRCSSATACPSPATCSSRSWPSSPARWRP